MRCTSLQALIALSLTVVFGSAVAAHPAQTALLDVGDDLVTSMVPDNVPLVFEDGSTDLVELLSDGDIELGATADVAAYLKAHNDFRAKHGARALSWDNTLAAKAQQWANRCQFKHSGGTLGPYGG
jgi:uncharacterized protein YkwD